MKTQIKRIKIGQGYFQSGYGKSLNKQANVYLINGKLYAKDKKGCELNYSPLKDDLEGYVRVNELSCKFTKNSDKITLSYYQVSDATQIDIHKEYKAVA